MCIDKKKFKTINYINFFLSWQSTPDNNLGWDWKYMGKIGDENYATFLNEFNNNNKKLIQKFERIKIKIHISRLFNQTCLKDSCLNYTYFKLHDPAARVYVWYKNVASLAQSWFLCHTSQYCCRPTFGYLLVASFLHLLLPHIVFLDHRAEKIEFCPCLSAGSDSGGTILQKDKEWFRWWK